jgi:type I restriction enzyme M protein
VPPTSNANYGWILNIVSKLSANGTAGFLLANGALSGDGTELEIRKQLLKNKLVEAEATANRNARPLATGGREQTAVERPL